MVFMVRKEEMFVIFMVLAVAIVLVSDANLTGSAITLQQTSANVQLCRAAGYADNCLFVEKQTISGEIQRQGLSVVDWNQKLLAFGVNCDNVLEGKMVLDVNGALQEVDVVVGKGGGFCKFNGDRRFLAEGSRIVYTPKDITVFLSTGVKIPQIISSEVFPSASQTSTRSTVKVCFKGADKYSLVNAELKRSDGTTSTVALFDEGNHFDNLKGDGCYGAVLDGLLTSGHYSIDYTISA